MVRRWSARTSRDEGRTVEEQLAYVAQQIERVEARLIDREAELVDLRVELSAFRLEYDTRVGRKVEELEQIESELRRCREQVSFHRQWGPSGPPRTRSGAAYVPVEEQYRRTWVEPEEPPPGFRSWAEVSPAGRAPAGANIKALYRQLCRRYHPDLTQDPQERARRTQIMAAINAAYAARNLTELQALAEKADWVQWVESGTHEQRLVVLRERLQMLEQRLEDAEREIRELMDGPTMQMRLEVKLAQRHGRDLLAEMSAQTGKDLERKRAELEFMQAQLRQLGRAG